MGRRLRRFLLVAVLLVGVFVWWSSATYQRVAFGDASHGLDRQSHPAIGSISGVKISVPPEYLLGWVQYEGQEPLDPKPVKTPTFDTKILNFAILLRLSNFQPIRTEQDKADYFASGKTVKPDWFETWVTIGFSPTHYWDVKDGVRRWEKDDAKRGPFVKDKEKPFGLTHEDSVQSLESDKFNLGHYEFFYDESTFNNFISCETSRRYKPMNGVFVLSNEISSRHCRHLFIIPDLMVVAEINYTKKDLPRWREIEAETAKILHSFIVQ